MGTGVGVAKGGQPRADSGLSFTPHSMARGQLEHFGQLGVSRSLPCNRDPPHRGALR